MFKNFFLRKHFQTLQETIYYFFENISLRYLATLAPPYISIFFITPVRPKAQESVSYVADTSASSVLQQYVPLVQ